MKKPQIHLTSYNQVLSQIDNHNEKHKQLNHCKTIHLKSVSNTKNRHQLNNKIVSKSNQVKSFVNIQRKNNKSKQKQAISQNNYSKNSKYLLFQKKVKNHQKQSEKSSFTHNSSISISNVLENYTIFLQQITKILLNHIKINDPTQLLSHKISYIEFLQCLKQLKMIDFDYDPFSKASHQSIQVCKLWNQYIAKNNVANFVNTIGVILGCIEKQQLQKQSQIKNQYQIQKQFKILIQNRNNLCNQKGSFNNNSGNKFNRVKTYASQDYKHQHISVNLRIQTQQNLLQTQACEQQQKHKNKSKLKSNQKEQGIQEPYSFRKQLKTDRVLSEHCNMSNNLISFSNQKISNKCQRRNLKNVIKQKLLKEKQNKCSINIHDSSLSPIRRTQIKSPKYQLKTDRHNHSINENIQNKFKNQSKNKKITNLSINCYKSNKKINDLDKNLLTQIHKNMNRNKDITGNRRSQILYKLGRQKSNQKRQDKSTVEYEYQRNIQYLTFKPTINSYNQSKKKVFNNNLRIQNRVKGQQSAIKRLLKGRIDKQVKRIIVQRGLSNNQLTIRKLRQEQYRQIIDSKKKTQKVDSKASISTAHNQQKQNLDIMKGVQFQQHLKNQSSLYHNQSNNIQIENDNLKKEQRIINQKHQINYLNENNKNHNKSKSPVIVPIIIGDQQFDLIVNQQQQTLQQIAQKFLIQHGMNNQQDKLKLVKQIQISLKYSLDRIQEGQQYDQNQDSILI